MIKVREHRHHVKNAPTTWTSFADSPNITDTHCRGGVEMPGLISSIAVLYFILKLSLTVVTHTTCDHSR